MCLRGAPALRAVAGPEVVTSPDATLNTVWRRDDSFGGSGFWDVAGGGGGGTENRARSCVSVSRIRDVMSWLEMRAFVKIFGDGKLLEVRICFAVP